MPFPYSCRRQLLLPLLAFPLPFCAQSGQGDRTLDSAQVTVRRVTAALRPAADGTYRWNLRQLDKMPQIAGNADPLRYTQLLPGVQTSAEYDAGLHVQGCDNGHNVTGIGGVRIYNPAHLLGFFSVFNASHFPAMRFSSQPVPSSGNHIGGSLLMELPEDIPSRTEGELSVGPLSSQGTLRLPLGRKTALHVSARQAYLNLLYDRWLRIDGSATAYDFGDYNLTVTHCLGPNDLLTANAYFGRDRVTLDEADWQMRTRLKWSNREASLHWTHRTDRWQLSQTLFTTAYRNDFFLNGAGVSFALPSEVTDYGYSALFRHSHLTVAAGFTAHDLLPQSPRVESDFLTDRSSCQRQRAGEMMLSASWDVLLTPVFCAVAGLKGSLFLPSGSRNFAALDPSLALERRFGAKTVLRLRYALLRQYLHQSGFSSSGLPTEYWFASDDTHRPQRAHSFSAAWETVFPRGNYRLSVEAYCKLLRHQTEYTGNVFDFLMESYDPVGSILHGRGENYGLGLMLQKQTGRLTGWVSYAVGRALRRFDRPDCPGRYPSGHERIHELNAAATCRVGRRWHLGGTFVTASGTPFTAPEEIFLINGYPVSRFGEHNSYRLRPYVRLDLSVNYSLRGTARRESGFNFSLYNCTAQKNDLFYSLGFHDGTVTYRPVRFAVRVLPSVSFYCKFR